MAEESANQNTVKENKKLNYWMISTFVLVAAVVVLLAVFLSGGITGNAINESDASQKAVDFYKTYNGMEIIVDSVKGVGSFYELSAHTASGQSGKVYLSKDGEYLADGLTSISEIEKSVKESQQAQATPVEVPKSDKPVVDLFVMSHCPYGVQAEAVLLPVMQLLGNKADIKVRFVYYAMHGKQEIDDNNIEYCLQKEQPQGFINFMNCFISSEDSTKCLASTNGIDKNKLNLCISNLDKQYKITELYSDKSTWLSGTYPSYPVEEDLNTQFQVQGSETFIVNGVHVPSVEYRWDSNKMKEVICNAFTTAPSECSQILNGSNTNAPANTGSCG